MSDDLGNCDAAFNAALARKFPKRCFHGFDVGNCPNEGCNPVVIKLTAKEIIDRWNKLGDELAAMAQA